MRMSIRFVAAGPEWPQWAELFIDNNLTEQQFEALKKPFLALPSCRGASLRTDRARVILDADPTNQENFVPEVKACARRHGHVVRITHEPATT